MTWLGGEWKPTPPKQWRAVQLDDGSWSVRSFGYASPVGADVVTNVRPDRDSAEQNAHAISALPEALDALRMALAEDGCDGDLCNHAWHEKARAAITKARGES